MSNGTADSYGMTTSLGAEHQTNERLIVDQIRYVAPWNKLDMVFNRMAEVHALQVAETRRRHPRMSEEEIRDRVAARWIGRELVDRVRCSQGKKPLFKKD